MSMQRQIGEERMSAKTVAHNVVRKARLNAKNNNLTASSTKPDQVMRYRMIAEAAYYRSERRGFIPGHELEDWLAGEMEITEPTTE
ncbi:MAG: DUF2934 domain-containing protein [Gammaproteobacteria bacterium]